MTDQTIPFPTGSSIVINGLTYQLVRNENNRYTVGEINQSPEWIECDKTAS